MKKLLTLFMIVFWLLTSNTYAIDLWFTKGTNWNVIPKWVSNRANFYYCTYNNWIDIQYCNADSPWALGISGYVIGGYSSDFFVNVYWPTNEQISLKWFWFEYENEGITYYQARYKWAVQYYNTFTIPSRTAYQYTNSIWNKFLFSEILVYDNQFTLYDPESNYWVSWIGDVRLENMMLIANPRKEEQNVFLIQLQKQKAFSLTVDKNQAWEIWKGNWVNKNFLKNLNFEKSYTLTSWGKSLFPTWFKSWNQGINFIYTEDIELQSMDWWGGKPDDKFQWWWGQSWGKWAWDWDYLHRLSEYNQCVSYRQNIKTYSKYLNSCSLWANQSWPINATESQRRRVLFMKLALWNWESELEVSSDDYDCYRYKQVRGSYIKKYWEKWQEFKKEAESDEYSDLDISVKCWGRPVPIKPASEEWSIGKLWDALSQIIGNVGKKIDLWSGNYVAQNDFEALMGKYMSYATACRDKTYMPTPDDNWTQFFTDLRPFFWKNNNEKVCQYADKLKKQILEKYWSAKFPEAYRKALNNELWEEVIDEKGKMNEQKLKEAANKAPSFHRKTPLDKWVESLVWYFTKSFNEWYDKGFSIVGYKSCWNWFWSKEWDYLVYVPLFYFLFKRLLKWRS